MMENWDLQAVVGGGSGSCSHIDQYAKESQQLSFDPWSSSSFQLDEHLMSNFPAGNLETNPRVLDELEQLYKPFYPDYSNPFSTQTIITTSLPVPRDVDELAEKQRKKQSFTTAAVTKDSPKPKRFSRKNQQNRVVQHVTADELPPDVWAWRKYGQKPIKGSPFPRSYYRCSSSKGCLARKQVERSSTDPRVFIITYSAEHCHGHPTRRSSLAGSTRNKSSTMAAKTVVDCKNEQPHAETETRVSTTTAMKTVKMKMEELEMVELDGEEERGKLLSPDIMLSNDLVERLENFDEGLFGDLSHEIWCTHE